MVTKRLQYRYDAVGNKVGMTDADGGLFTYTYDVMRRLTGVVNPLGERTTYTYDLNGRRTSVQQANGTRTSYSYDQGSRVQQIHTLKSNNSTVAKFDYAYDDNGRRTSVLEADGSRVTWTYDGTSQVTSEWRTGTSPFRHTFVYDTRGNRTLKVEDGARTTLVYDAANQLSSSQDAGGTTNYTYDANGNQHVTVAPGGSRTTQIWDYENRLVKTLQPGAGVFTMAYDADGLRVRKETPSEAKLFVWDDQNYLAETDAAGVTEVAYTTEPSTYGSTISHRTGGATTTYHFDALAAARALTNSSETVLESYNYTAFGTILGAPTLLTPFLWGGLVGYYWDADLATQYIRARHYQPNIARWISLDPIGFAGGDANLFRYVGNSPLGSIDSSGLRKVCCQYSYGVFEPKKWVKEVDCADGQSAESCCGSRNGAIYRWTVVGVGDGPCELKPNCTRMAAGSTAVCAFAIAIPTDPTDVVGTPGGVCVGVAAGITYLCCAKAVIDAPTIDWPVIDVPELGKEWWQCTFKARGSCPAGCGFHYGVGGSYAAAYAAAFADCVASGCNTPGGKPFSCQCGHPFCIRLK